MTKKKTDNANLFLCGACFALCFFSFMLTEASVNERCAEVLGEKYVNIVYAVGLVCTGLGYLSFPAMRKTRKKPSYASSGSAAWRHRSCSSKRSARFSF